MACDGDNETEHTRAESGASRGRSFAKCPSPWARERRRSHDLCMLSPRIAPTSTGSRHLSFWSTIGQVTEARKALLEHPSVPRKSKRPDGEAESVMASAV